MNVFERMPCKPLGSKKDHPMCRMEEVPGLDARSRYFLHIFPLVLIADSNSSIKNRCSAFTGQSLAVSFFCAVKHALQYVDHSC